MMRGSSAMDIDVLYAGHQHAMEAVTHAGRWSDWTDAAFERRRSVIRETLQRLESTRLPPQQPAAAASAMDWQLLARELRLELEAIDYRLHAFPVNQLMGVPNQTADGLRIPFFLANRHPLASISDANAIIDLVGDSEDHLRQMAAAIKAGTRRGISMPREAILATRIVLEDSLRGIPCSGAGEPHPIYRRMANWAAQAQGPSQSTLQDVLKRLAAALSGPLRRGYALIDDTLEEMLARGRSSFGVWDLPDGDAFYKHCLQRWSGTAESPDSLHRLGLEEVARIQAEIRPLLGKTGKDLELCEIGERIRQAPDACFPGTAAGAEAYLTRVRSLVELIFDRLRLVTTWRPQAALEIREVEKSRQSGALYAEFYPASADGKQPSLYLVNTGDMSRLPIAELAALAFHESVPGHHLQLCTTQERTDLAEFRRKPFLYESYCEGWAMYSEQLGCDLLADVLSPPERLGCLSRRLWMAARLVVDTGIHALRWPRSEAVHFLRSHTFATPPMIEQEVDRMSVWPGQGTAYHVGYLAFSKLRNLKTGTVQAVLPPASFHDRLFQLGPVPADMLLSAFDSTAC